MRRVADEGRGGAETLLRRERLTLDRLDCFRTVDPFHREVVRVASIKQGPRLTGPLHGAWEGLRLGGDYFFAASAAAVFTSTSTSFLFNWGMYGKEFPIHVSTMLTLRGCYFALTFFLFGFKTIPTIEETNEIPPQEINHAAVVWQAILSLLHTPIVPGNCITIKDNAREIAATAKSMSFFANESAEHMAMSAASTIPAFAA